MNSKPCGTVFVNGDECEGELIYHQNSWPHTGDVEFWLCTECGWAEIA